VSQDVLPDSRTRARGGIVQVRGQNYVPVYCINCGKPAGMVPEKLITNVTALCDDGCSGKYGALADQMVDPDAIFREHLGEALGPLGHVVTPEELDRMLQEPSPALRALARDWHAHASKENR
jgi:hypothetical protein